METLSERLEVRLPPETVHLLRREAERRQISVAKLVREAIDLLLREDREARLRAAEALFQVGAPTADWPQLRQAIWKGPNVEACIYRCKRSNVCRWDSSSPKRALPPGDFGNR